MEKGQKMDNQVYLICYGDSEKNVKLSFETKIIGAGSYAKVPEGQQIYLVYKKNGEWTVVGRAIIDKVSDGNPFEKPNRYRTYSVKDLEKCKPFSIKDICRQALGEYYGLVLRTPQPIRSNEFIDYLDKNFIVL